MVAALRTAGWTGPWGVEILSDEHRSAPVEAALARAADSARRLSSSARSPRAERQDRFVADRPPASVVEVPGVLAACRRGRAVAVAQTFWGKPSSMPPWLGSSQREVTTLPRVKKCTPSMPWAWVSPKRLLFQPPKE